MEKRWWKALLEIWHLNRAHVGTDISKGYRKLRSFYRDIKIFGYQSGKIVNGWKVPKGWDVKKATLATLKGKVIADWKKNKLCLWMYSTNFKGKISKKNLMKKLFFDKKRPNRTLWHFRNQYNFWKSEWGFSLPYNKIKKLKDKMYRVEIDSRFFKSKMEMAEQVHRGIKKESVLFIGHFDHPQMCLDGLVGCLAGHEVLQRLKGKKTRYTYRMLSTVEIIGSVFYAKYKSKKNNVKQALFLATSGANQKLHYQKTYGKNNLIDRATLECLKYLEKNFETSEFRKGPLGNDEVAFDVGGVDIPCGSICRAPFKTYHTELDVPSGVSKKKFEETVILLEEIIFTIDNNCFIKRNFKGLPRLSSEKNSLYLSPSFVSGVNQKFDDNIYKTLFRNLNIKQYKYLLRNTEKFNHLMNSIPNMANGNYTILDIAEANNLPFRFVYNYLLLWEKKGLIKKKWGNLN